MTGNEASLLEQQDKDILVVAKGGGFALVGTIATRSIHYVYYAVLIRGLGAENFGLFTLALAIITFLGVLADLGLDLGIIRFGAIRAHIRDQAGVHRTTMTALRVSLFAGLLALAAVLVSAGSIAEGVFHKPQLAPLIRALGMSIPFMIVISLLLAATRALKIIKYSVYVGIVQPLAGLALAIPLLARGMGIQAISLSLVASYALGAALALYFYLQAIPRRDGDAESIPLGQMLRFSVPLSITKWMHYANERTEVLFLGLLPRAVDIGIYNIAWRLAGLETIFRLSLETILAPFSSDLSHRQEIKHLETLYKTTAKWAFTGALLLFSIYALFGKAIMSVFDPAFVAGAGVLVALGFAQLFNEFTGACGTVLIMSGRSDLSLLNSIILFISSVALDWLLIPRYGLAGAAVAGTLTIILVNILRVMEVWMTLRIHPFKPSLVKPVLAGLLSAAVVLSLRTFVFSGSLLVDLIYAMLFSAIYMATLLLLKLDAEDRVVIQAMRRKVSGPPAALKGGT